MELDDKTCVQHDDVAWAYRTVLLREPESRETIQYWVDRCRDIRALVQELLRSNEYQQLRDGVTVPLYHWTHYQFLQPIDINNPLMVRSYITHIYEREESDCIAQSLKPGDWCVDLGARDGWFTSLMASIVGEDGRVYAFEPDESRRYIELSVAINKFNCVRLIAKGASDRDGTVEFDIATTSFGASPITIETVRLDEALRGRENPICLMKIDIEGAEYKALSGAREILAVDRPLIVMEIADEHQKRVSGLKATECIRLLREAGYDPHHLDGSAAPDVWIDSQIASDRIFNLLFKHVSAIETL